MSLIALMGLVVLVAACTSDVAEPAGGTETESVDEQRTQTTPLYLIGYVAPYEEVLGAMSRSGFSYPGYEPPTKYMQIEAYFTKDGGSLPEQRTIRHSSTSDKWFYTPPDEIPGANYQVYGYMPHDIGEVTITPNSTYAEGVTMNFTKMNIVTAQDLCVMVGAKHATAYDNVTGDYTFGDGNPKPGDFDCKMTSGENASNYIFLFFDHIYASISFRFRVHEDYAKVRSIHLKKLQLTPYTDNTYTVPRYKEMTATIVLKKKTDGSSPIQSIALTNDPTSGAANQETFFEGDKELTPITWSEEMAYVPYTKSYYILRSTYDIYDKKGNLIRQNQVAETKLNPFYIFNVRDMERGKKYVLKLTVAPTYLYQLSDQDLDNPTIIIN